MEKKEGIAMSIKAIVWAFEQDIKPATTKFVLVAFADCVNDEGIGYPSILAMSEKTSLDRKTVIAALDKLEEMGFLHDTGKRVGRTGRVKVYRLGKQSQNRDDLNSTDFPNKQYRFSQVIVPFFPVNSTENGTRNRKEPKGNRKGTGNGDDKKEKFDPLAVELPACIPMESWKAWIAYRRERGLTLTPTTIKAQVAKLSMFAGTNQAPAEIIAQSIDNGWQGLFELKARAKASAKLDVSPEFKRSQFEYTHREPLPEDQQISFKD